MKRKLYTERKKERGKKKEKKKRKRDRGYVRVGVTEVKFQVVGNFWQGGVRDEGAGKYRGEGRL